MGHPDGSEHIESHDGPAAGAEMFVDLECQPAIAAATLGRPAPIGAASFRAAAVQNDLDGRIAGKRAPDILVESLLVTRDDEDLLGDVRLAVVATLRAVSPALGNASVLGPYTRPLVEELGHWNPGISAARQARWHPDFKACLAIEAQRQAAKGQIQ